MATLATPKRKRTKSVKTTAKLIPAVLYLRRSDKKQEASIDRQREDVTAFGQKYTVNINGETYHLSIIREYVEDGVSGDDYDKRVAFQQMYDDALHKRDFEIILCWDIKRFGRFESIEAGYRIFPLRQAGIRLITCVEGVVDWTSLSGRMNYMFQQEAANDDNKSKSANVLPGQIRQAKKGSWVGSVPYGYTLETVPRPDGEKPFKKLVIGRKDFIANKNHIGDKRNARVVKRIFQEFIGPDNRSLNNIASRLNDEGINSPGWGKKGRENRWVGDTVKAILENPVYTGTFVFNKTSRSKYYHYTNGDTTKGSRKGLNPESDWIVIPNHHTALVTKADYDKAQEKLAKGKTGKSPHTPETNPYLFPPGLLRCSRCGKGMWGASVKYHVQGKHGPADERWRLRVVTYECSMRKHGKCKGTVVKESELLEGLVSYLETAFGITEDVSDKLWEKAQAGTLTRKDLPESFDKLKRLMLGNMPKPVDTKRNDKEIKSLESQITTARRNLVRIKNAENISVAESEIETMKLRLAELKSKVRDQPTDQDINTAVLQVLKKLVRLLMTNQPRVLKKAARELLTELESMTVYTNMTGKGNGTRHTLERVEFKLVHVGGVRGKLNPHQPD